MNDTRYRTLAAVVIWLLIWRVVVPGFFEYDTGLDSARSFSTMVEQEALFNNALWFGCLGIALLIISSRVPQALMLTRSLNVFLKVVLALATASILWSVDAKATGARLTHVIIITLDCAAVCLAGGWNPRRFQDVVRPILTSILVVSIIFGMAYPELAIMPRIYPDPRYYWHGLAAHKNGFGAIASTAAIFWFHGLLSKETNFFKAVAGVGVSLLCLYLAKSSTSWMVTGFAFILMLMLLRSPTSLRRYMPYIVGAFALLVLMYAVAVLKLIPGSEILLYPITVLTGKDTTFTDRTKIWEAVEMHIRQSPFLGTGYGAYWVGPFPTSASYIFLGIMYMYPWESHNGYLDMVNDLGYIGILGLIGYIVVFIRQSLRLMKLIRTQAALYLALMFQGLLSNLSETSWFKPDFWFVVITFATFAIARQLSDIDTLRREA
ncbi:MAG: O-antigen ligase family protein [Steroidobacteraceae bacterium]